MLQHLQSCSEINKSNYQDHSFVLATKIWRKGEGEGKGERGETERDRQIERKREEIVSTILYHHIVLFWYYSKYIKTRGYLHNKFNVYFVNIIL